jgi:ribulose-phosphate 3-epimerase
MNLLSPQLIRRIKFFQYSYRFLVMYFVIGGFSIFLEIISYRGLEAFFEIPGWSSIFPPDTFLFYTSKVSKLMGVFVSIFTAYWLNIRFNFHVPFAKRYRAFAYFASISLLSLLVNYLFRRQLENAGWSYESSRFLVAGVLFAFGYLLHRKLSFKDRKKVGVAVYANGVEDIRGIHNRIGIYPDFIHVDIIDHTFGVKDQDPRIYRMEVMRAYWMHQQVHVHIMSKEPSRWIGEVVPYSDLIMIHYEIDEDPGVVLDQIQKAGKRPCLCVTMATPIEEVRPLLSKIDTLLLLTIKIPGQSGQKFDMEALERLSQVNSWPERSDFCLCVDGGVNEKNVGLIDAEYIVSGSSVLNHPNPVRQIMRLQTSSSYESI